MNIRLLKAFVLITAFYSIFTAINASEKNVTLKMASRKISAVDFLNPQIKLSENTTIYFSGQPQKARSAIAIKYRSSNWNGFDYLTLRLKLSRSLNPKTLKVALRNSRKYYKLEDASLKPLIPEIKANKWQEVTYDISNVPRGENVETRIYLNFDKRLTGKNLSGEIQIQLEKSSPKIKKLSLGKPRKRIFPKPYLAARAHVKYGLHINWFSDPDYFAERILLLDRNLEKGADSNDPYGIGGKANFIRSLEIMRMSGIDGMAMLNIDISSSYLNRTLNGIKYADAAGLKDAIIPEISIFSKGTGQEYLDKQIKNQGVKALGADALMEKLIPAAVNSPSTFKYQGKTLISSYQACVQPPEFWGSYLKKCRKKVGDKILFLVELRTIFFNAMHRYYKNGGLTQRELNEMRNYLNSYLKVCDGIHFAGQNHLTKPDGSQQLYTEYYRNIVIPLINEVMNQPQNKSKLLGLGVSKGYVNHLASAVQSEDGTRNLRTTIETVAKVNPDYMVLVEWNEVKERTNLEPTIADGRSSMRILSYYFNKLKGEANVPLPGDDLKVPNIILSYRPQLAPGEALNFELLNVPDEAEPSGIIYNIKLELLNLEGKIVKTFPVRKLSSKTISETRYLTYADSNIAKEFVLTPKLTITTSNGERLVFAKGFPYINISATELRDEKYFKIPLRDLPQPENCKFQAKLKDGGALISASIMEREKLAFVEVLRNRRPVFNATADKKYKLNDGQSLIKISWNAWRKARKMYPAITISTDGGNILSANFSNRGWGRDFSFKQKNNRIITVNLSKLTHGARRGIYIIISKGTKQLTISGNGFSRKLDVPQLIKNGFYRLAPGNGFNILIEDFKRIPDLPPHLDKKSCVISQWIPDINKRDIISLRYITEDGRIFRTKPQLFSSRLSCVEVDAWNDKEDKPEKIKCSNLGALPITYKFDPAYGAMLTAPGFDSRFNAQLGGSTNYGDPFFNRDNFPKKSKILQPKWETSNGKPVLSFDGKGNNLVVPLYATPARAFTFEIEVKPESEKPQLLLRSYSKTAGPFTVILDAGKLNFRFVRNNHKAISVETPKLLKQNAWNKVSIAFDLKNIKIKVDNSKVLVYKCQGKPSKMTQMVFGGIGNARYYKYFKGKLKSLKIYPYSTL